MSNLSDVISGVFGGLSYRFVPDRFFNSAIYLF